MIKSVSGQIIKCKIVDSTQTPIPFAVIGVLNSNDSSLIGGNIADYNGSCLIQNLHKGIYFLKITAVGFAPLYSSMINLDTTSVIDLLNITLKQQGNNLNEISVSAIQKNIDALKPKLDAKYSVYQVSGIRMDSDFSTGKPKLLVHLDGKLKANDVKKNELITLSPDGVKVVHSSLN